MKTGIAVHPEEDLERLLELEQRLETLLAQARHDAARLVQEAEAASTARDSAVESELIAATAALEARIEREREQREQEVTAAAAQQAARYDQVTGPAIERFAALVVERLLASEDRP